jgi:hypothetical protein
MDKLLQWFFQFVVLVWNLRKYQKLWFKEHRQSSLVWSKHYESEVDRELAKRLIVVAGEPHSLNVPEEVESTHKQGNLFTGEN